MRATSSACPCHPCPGCLTRVVSPGDVTRYELDWMCTLLAHPPCSREPTNQKVELPGLLARDVEARHRQSPVLFYLHTGTPGLKMGPCCLLSCTRGFHARGSLSAPVSGAAIAHSSSGSCRLRSDPCLEPRLDGDRREGWCGVQGGEASAQAHPARQRVQKGAGPGSLRGASHLRPRAPSCAP